MENKNNCINKKYGKLIIVKVAGKDKGDRKTVLCQCDCGNTKEIRLADIKSGRIKSCGCLRKENTSSITHGLYKHKLYKIFYAMKDRCYRSNDQNYHYYGGRGIKICQEWLDDFKCFYDWCMNNGWKDGLEIDRENNDGNYEPSNCRFVTHMGNVQNQRLIISNNQSGYRGVYYSKRDKNYQYKITSNYKIYKGYGFQTAKEAAIARDKFIIENNLPSLLNFSTQ